MEANNWTYMVVYIFILSGNWQVFTQFDIESSPQHGLLSYIQGMSSAQNGVLVKKRRIFIFFTEVLLSNGDPSLEEFLQKMCLSYVYNSVTKNHEHIHIALHNDINGQCRVLPH